MWHYVELPTIVASYYTVCMLYCLKYLDRLPGIDRSIIWQDRQIDRWPRLEREREREGERGGGDG